MAENYKAANLNSSKEFVEDLIKSRTQVFVIMINGYQMKGNIVGADQDALFVYADHRTQMVYKHAISTISICS